MGPSPTTASETSLMTFVSTPRGGKCRSSQGKPRPLSTEPLLRPGCELAGAPPNPPIRCRTGWGGGRRGCAGTRTGGFLSASGHACTGNPNF